MELDQRQGDLFLDLLQGGVKDEKPNYRAKVDEQLKAYTVDKFGNWVNEPKTEPLPK